MVLGLKEYLVECATLCIKSEVILLYVNRIMKKVRYLWTSHGPTYAIRAFNLLATALLMAGSVELQPKQNNNKVKLQITYFNNIIIFLLERGHNDSFLVFTFVGCQLVLNNKKFKARLFYLLLIPNSLVKSKSPIRFGIKH